MGFLYVPQKQGCFLYIMQLTKGHFLYLPQKQSRFYLSQKKDRLISSQKKTVSHLSQKKDCFGRYLNSTSTVPSRSSMVITA
jgi:hypothetical protein